MTAEQPQQRDIPEPIKRLVRQRCGFGCVICGLPLYEYEHMEEWAIVKRHVAEEITLLCDRHHREKTGKLLPIEEVKSNNDNPFNLREGVTPPYSLHFRGDFAEIVIGSNTIKTGDLQRGIAALVIDGTVLIGFHFEDGHVLLNMLLLDENNICIMQIVKNQLVFSIDPWDVQLIGTTLTIRSAAREILVEIIFSPPNKVIINRGRILFNGIEMLIKPTHIFILNNSFTLSGALISESNYGMMLGEPFKPGAFVIKKIRRYGIDRKAALAEEKKGF